LNTRITALLGIRYPILCGGMMRLATPPLCAAISDAGGLGNLTAAIYPDKPALAGAIREVKRRTPAPFMVNVTLLPAVNVGPAQYRGYFEAICEERVAAVEIGGMPLDRFQGGVFFKALQDAGVKLFHKVGSVRHGQHAESAGYHGVIAAGFEEGGHPLGDNVATTVLTPRMAETLRIPVVAAGGMADGRSLAAALCLGAEGMLMATRFVATRECGVHENVHRTLVDGQENQTVLYGRSIGLQGRALLNDSIREVLEIEARGGGLEEILPHISGRLADGIWLEGKMDRGLVPVGQSMGLIHDVPSCRELLDRIVSDARRILGRAGRLFETAVSSPEEAASPRGDGSPPGQAAG